MQALPSIRLLTRDGRCLTLMGLLVCLNGDKSAATSQNKIGEVKFLADPVVIARVVRRLAPEG
jgi:hypothetical protein